MWFLFGLFCLVVVSALFIRHRDLVAAAYYSGYRKACKDAVDVVKKEADTTLEGAPEGKLTEALYAASKLGNAKHGIRDLSFRIGRPVDRQ